MTGNKIIDEHVDIDKMNMITMIIEAGEILDNQDIPMDNRMGTDKEGHVIKLTDENGRSL